MPVAEDSRRRSALIVATDEYADQRLRKLRSPAHDVRDLERVLGDPAIGAFEVEVVTNSSEHQVRRRIDTFFKRGAPGDVLLLHLSCHGVKDDYGHLYFATADTELDSLDSTAVASDWLRRQIDRSRSRSVVVQLDCCYSGAFTSAANHRAAQDTLDVRGYLAGEQPDGRGRVILTASSSIEYALEGGRVSGEGEASIFTRSVVAGLEHGDADLDGDGQVSVDELYEYVYAAVRATTSHQTPGKWADVRGDIFIARSPRGPRSEGQSAPTLPMDVVAAIESPHAAARAGAVAHLAVLQSGPNRTIAETARSTLRELVLDDSPVVLAAAYAALRGHHYTWIRAAAATRLALVLVALGIFLSVVANLLPMYKYSDGTLSGGMFAYQTLGVAVAAAGVSLAFLANRIPAQFIAGFFLGAAAASGVAVLMALVDVGGNYIVPRTPTTFDEYIFEGGNGISQRYDPFIAWLLATVSFLVAGLLLGALAFGLRSPIRLRTSAVANLVVLVGAVAVIAGTLMAPETFAFDRYGVRFGVGERHGFQPLILGCAAILIIGANRLLPRDFDTVLHGAMIGIGVVLALYFAGIILILHAPRDLSAGVALASVGSLAVLVGAWIGAEPWRRQARAVAVA